MALNKKIIDRCYKPYRDEALYAFIRDVAVFLACILFLVVIIFTQGRVEKNLITFLSVFAIFLFVFLFLSSFSIHILSVIERKRYKAKEIKLKIECIELEYCFFTGIKGRSSISKLYPETMEVDRFKIICRDENNKKVALRSVMSRKKHWMILAYLETHQDEYLYITCGELTKIVLYYKDGKGNSLEWNYRL